VAGGAGQEGLLAMDDDERPASVTFQIGDDLSLLSIADLERRITTLESEIGRLRADIAEKQASRAQAEDFFNS